MINIKIKFRYYNSRVDYLYDAFGSFTLFNMSVSKNTKNQIMDKDVKKFKKHFYIAIGLFDFNFIMDVYWKVK